jgi:conserved hypothetical protein, YceG family
MKKKLLIILGVIVALIITTIIVVVNMYDSGLKPVSSESKVVEIEVPNGSTYYSLADALYEKELIKSILIYKVYLKLNPPAEGLTAGTYSLNKNMGVKLIIESLSKGGKSSNPDQISITFKEGLNIPAITKVIVANTNNKEEDVYNLLKNKEYLNELITKYWFIDKSILNDKLYYSLEGYLYPDTYNFKNKDVTVKEIFEVMLNEMEKKLVDYKEDIMKSNYTFHEILTLASIVELEAVSDSDRKGVAAVFFNRLARKEQLGSDVTTYYGSRVNMADRDLYRTEIDDQNAYNTRPASMAGKLPVGPICNTSKSSIEAVLYPDDNIFYYFVSDNKGKVYFTKTYYDHQVVIADLKKKGLWERY